MLIAIPVVLGSLLRIPLGALTDRFGGRRVFGFTLAFSALPAVLLGYAHSYWALLGVGFLLGFSGASFAVGIPFVSGWYGQERQGFALGVYGVGNIGTAVAAFTAPAIYEHWGQDVLGWITAPPCSRGAWLFLYQRPRRAARGHRARATSRWFAPAGGCTGSRSSTSSPSAASWRCRSSCRSCSRTGSATRCVGAGLRAAGFTIAATLARPVGGWLADRFGAYPVLVLAFAGVAVDAAVLATLAPNRGSSRSRSPASRSPGSSGGQRRGLQARPDRVPARRGRPRRASSARPAVSAGSSRPSSWAWSRTPRAPTPRASSACWSSSAPRSRSPSGCCERRPADELRGLPHTPGHA